MSGEQAQDSVSDVERLRAALHDIMDHFGWRDRGPGHHHTVKGVWDDDASNGDRAGKPCEWCEKWENARHLAALAVPINKIGEDARTYADGVEDAARYVEGHGGVIPGATAFIPAVIGDRMPSMSGDGRDRLRPARRREFDDATRSLATAIRRLSTSTDKGVSNGR